MRDVRKSKRREEMGGKGVAKSSPVHLSRDRVLKGKKM